MKIKKIICYVLMFVSVFVLFACDYNPTQTKIEISGTVYFNNAPLDGVSIRSNTKNFCTTENDGNFIFEENSNSITIFAEKGGYIFSPKSITLSKSQSGIIFEATGPGSPQAVRSCVFKVVLLKIWRNCLFFAEIFLSNGNCKTIGRGFIL